MNTANTRNLKTYSSSSRQLLTSAKYKLADFKQSTWSAETQLRNQLKGRINKTRWQDGMNCMIKPVHNAKHVIMYCLPHPAALHIDTPPGSGDLAFPEDRLSDGGSSRAAKVVPDDFGTDWTAEITSYSNRMRKSGRNHMKITAQTEAVSSPPEEKWHWSQQWRQNTFRAGQKLKAEKRLV